MPKVNDLKQFILMERQQRNNLAAFNLLAKKEDPVSELRQYLDSGNKRTNIFHIDDLKHGQPTEPDLKLMVSVLKLLQTSFKDLTIPAPFKNSSEEIDIEMKFVRMLRKLTENPDTVRNITEEDKDLLSPFLRFAEANHLPVDESFLRLLMDDVNALSMRFKYMFNRPRPKQLAAQKGLELVTHEGTSANSPSYPSGHSVAGRVLGKALADRYPNFAEDFEKIGATIGLNRLIAGLHYPTDHAAGVMLGDQIYSKGLVKDYTNFMMPESEDFVRAVQQAITKHAEGFNLNKSIDDIGVLVDIFKADDKRKVTVHSGGAAGSDDEWAKAFPDEVIGHSYKNHRQIKNTTGRKIWEDAHLLSDEHQGKYADAAKWLGKSVATDPRYKDNTELLMGRNWEQVKNSDAVVAIIEGFSKKGDTNKNGRPSYFAGAGGAGNSPKGGTGYAVAMGIQKGIPVHVFNIETDNWLTWNPDSNAWDETSIDDIPHYKNFAGVGTRGEQQSDRSYILQDNAKAAIQAYAGKIKTFQKGTEPFFTPSVRPQAAPQATTQATAQTRKSKYPPPPDMNDPKYAGRELEGLNLSPAKQAKRDKAQKAFGDDLNAWLDSVDNRSPIAAPRTESRSSKAPPAPDDSDPDNRPAYKPSEFELFQELSTLHQNQNSEDAKISEADFLTQSKAIEDSIKKTQTEREAITPPITEGAFSGSRSSSKRRGAPNEILRTGKEGLYEKDESAQKSLEQIGPQVSSAVYRTYQPTHYLLVDDAQYNDLAHQPPPSAHENKDPESADAARFKPVRGRRRELGEEGSASGAFTLIDAATGQVVSNEDLSGFLENWVLPEQEVDRENLQVKEGRDEALSTDTEEAPWSDQQEEGWLQQLESRPKVKKPTSSSPQDNSNGTMLTIVRRPAANADEKAKGFTGISMQRWLPMMVTSLKRGMPPKGRGYDGEKLKDGHKRGEFDLFGDWVAQDIQQIPEGVTDWSTGPQHTMNASSASITPTGGGAFKVTIEVGDTAYNIQNKLKAQLFEIAHNRANSNFDPNVPTDDSETEQQEELSGDKTTFGEGVIRETEDFMDEIWSSINSATTINDLTELVESTAYRRSELFETVTKGKGLSSFLGGREYPDNEKGEADYNDDLKAHVRYKVDPFVEEQEAIAQEAADKTIAEFRERYATQIKELRPHQKPYFEDGIESYSNMYTVSGTRGMNPTGKTLLSALTDQLMFAATVGVVDTRTGKLTNSDFPNFIRRGIANLERLIEENTEVRDPRDEPEITVEEFTADLEREDITFLEEGELSEASKASIATLSQEWSDYEALPETADARIQNMRDNVYANPANFGKGTNVGRKIWKELFLEPSNDDNTKNPLGFRGPIARMGNDGSFNPRHPLSRLSRIVTKVKRGDFDESKLKVKPPNLRESPIFYSDIEDFCKVFGIDEYESVFSDISESGQPTTTPTFGKGSGAINREGLDFFRVDNYAELIPLFTGLSDYRADLESKQADARTKWDISGGSGEEGEDGPPEEGSQKAEDAILAKMRERITGQALTVRFKDVHRIRDEETGGASEDVPTLDDVITRRVDAVSADDGGPPQLGSLDDLVADAVVSGVNNAVNLRQKIDGKLVVGPLFSKPGATGSRRQLVRNPKLKTHSISDRDIDTNLIATEEALINHVLPNLSDKDRVVVTDKLEALKDYHFGTREAEQRLYDLQEDGGASTDPQKYRPYLDDVVNALNREFDEQTALPKGSRLQTGERISTANMETASPSDLDLRVADPASPVTRTGREVGGTPKTLDPANRIDAEARIETPERSEAEIEYEKRRSEREPVATSDIARAPASEKFAEYMRGRTQEKTTGTELSKPDAKRPNVQTDLEDVDFSGAVGATTPRSKSEGTAKALQDPQIRAELKEATAKIASKQGTENAQ